MLPPASESLGESLAHLLGRVLKFANGGVPGSIAAALIVFYHKRIWQWWTELKNSRDSKWVYVWNLVPRRRSKRGNAAVTLLRAINQGAVDAAQRQFDEGLLKTRTRTLRDRALRAVKESLPFALRPSKATMIWTPMFPKLRTAQQFFVFPPCREEEFGETVERPESNGVDTIRHWLERSATAATDESAGKVWVFSDGTAGKSIFMNRLFLDLIGVTDGSATTLVPMFASAENLRGHSDRIDRLNRDKDVVSAFATVWLENRNIEFPKDVSREDVVDSLVGSLKAALLKGDVVLLMDGVDELGHQGLERFARDLLGEVRFWVASSQPGDEPVPTNHAVTLDDVWSYGQIAQRLDLRFPDPPPGAKASPMVASREILKSVIRELIEDHEKTVNEGITDQEHHWLCHPGNLGQLIDALEREMLTDEHEIRRLAANQSHLFRMIFKNAMHGVGRHADKREIEKRLFDLAAGDPTNPRRKKEKGGTHRAHDPIDKEILHLKQIVRGMREGPVFRHAAFRDYFIAGRIASEIVDRTVEEEAVDELARADIWDSARFESVLSWLREESPAKAAQRVKSRLRRRGESDSSAINPTMRRNLLDLLLRLDRGTALDHLDLSAIPGTRIDLQGVVINSCRFDEAVLIDAELAQAVISASDFRRADFTGADAFSATFTDCNFGATDQEKATVNGMAIAAAKFPTSDGRDQRDLLLDRGARDERSRYRGPFGKIFSESQSALLGPGLARLEKGAYLEEIRKAVRYWNGAQPDEPIYLVDLMAGGSYRRVTALLEEFDNLYILGIDRDPSTQPPLDRFSWTQVEIGSNGESSDLGLDISTALSNAFGISASMAHVIIAKKALHELMCSDDASRHLQPLLIRRCAESLLAGGRLILFEDAPGPEDEKDLNRGMLKEIHARLESLRRDHLSGSFSNPAKVADTLKSLAFDGSPTSQIGFVNTWIMLKDWANQNRHEVQNRYFASVAEIRGWANVIFTECEPAFDNYRLNPLIFNELGLQTVLYHVAREMVARDVDKATVIREDRSHLHGLISDSARLKILIDFSRAHLSGGSALGRALNAVEEPISLAAIDPDLAPLDTSERAWAFDLRCAVLVFEKT